MILDKKKSTDKIWNCTDDGNLWLGLIIDQLSAIKLKKILVGNRVLSGIYNGCIKFMVIACDTQVRCYKTVSAISLLTSIGNS